MDFATEDTESTEKFIGGLNNLSKTPHGHLNIFGFRDNRLGLLTLIAANFR